MAVQQDYTQKFYVQKEFTATGMINSGSPLLLAKTVRVVIENVGGGNTVVVRGRLKGQAAWTDLATINGATAGQSIDASNYDEMQMECTAYAASGGTPKLLASGFFELAGAGTGSVTSVGTGTGLTGGPITTTGTVSLDPAVIDAGALIADSFVGTSAVGAVESIVGWARNSAGGSAVSIVVEPDNDVGSFSFNSESSDVNPISASPDDSWNLHNRQINIDTQNDGFAFGTNVTAVRFTVNNLVHSGLSDMGSIEFIQNNFGLGNGTDPIDVKGIAYMMGFGQVNANVNISGPMQGYGFQFAVNAAATISSSTYTQAFYDNLNVDCASPNHTSFNASPSLVEVINNNNYQGLSVNPTIDTFTGNASFFGMNVGGNLGTFDTGSFFGINIASSVDDVKQAYGINVTMDNVTPYAGVNSSVVIQDLTYTAALPGTAYDAVTIAYTAGGTAGSEVVTVLGTAISVQIDSGVSTATQVKAAIDGSLSALALVSVAISGTAGNAQVTVAATNLAGGEDPGTVLAGNFDGDVSITGDLTFSGALSIGNLNAFASQVVVNAAQPSSIHSLVSQPTVAANATVANADTFGINTAMLVSVGDNATVTSGAINVGLTALGMPAVVTLGTGASVDNVGGAIFALSLDAGAGGGTIDNLNLCRTIAIPNGVTTVTNLRGYYMDLPFGDPGTTSWGVYIEPSVHNYMAGDLIIGASDTPSNASVALEIDSTTKVVLLPRLTSAQEGALTAVDGMLLYNSDTGKFRGRASGAWVDLN